MSAVEVATYKNYIDGTWVPARSAQVMESLNPATGEVLGLAPKSGPEDVEAAVRAPARAYESWRKVPAPRRAEILFRVAELILQRKEDLARLMTQEMGKVLPETRGHVQEAIDMAYFIAAEGGRRWAKRCARLGKRVSLEMGGKNAAIVMPDADLGLATDALIWSTFGTTGQRCTACR